MIGDDHHGNLFLTFVQGDYTKIPLKDSYKITDERFITLAQRFLDEMKHEM